MRMRQGGHESSGGAPVGRSDSGGPLNSKDVKAGQQFSFTFTQSGTFPYYCEYHGDKGGVDMAGTVVVR